VDGGRAEGKGRAGAGYGGGRGRAAQKANARAGPTPSSRHTAIGRPIYHIAESKSQPVSVTGGVTGKGRRVAELLSCPIRIFTSPLLTNQYVTREQL
jgi:hypothetical protein